ncbi:MAG: hypothetical protein JO332_06835 [Planctomycetaceae bacterium]|nr:hypothetical protein [Planctomycetaceae bacterium]
MTTRVWPLSMLSGAASEKPREGKPEATGFLLIESDRRLAKRLQAALQAPCSHYEDGARAMAHLQGEGPYADRKVHPLPQAILVDLEHSRDSGLDFLQWTRGTPSLRLIPVIVFKHSFSADDLQEAYSQGAVSCIEFPADDVAAARVAEGLKRYWLGLNLPPLVPPPSCAHRATGSERSLHGP